MSRSKITALPPALILVLLAVAAIATAAASDPSVTMISGKSEAVVGETISLSGTVSGVDTDKVYLLLSGNGLDEDGVTMVNLNYKASEGRFTEVETKSGKWTYQWNTDYIGGFTPGHYTIHAMSGPVPLTELEGSGVAHTSLSVVIKSSSAEKEPLITISAEPPGANIGNPIRLTGYCEGVNTRSIYLFVTGAGIDKNGAPLGDLSAKASEGSFSEVKLTSGSYLYTWDTSVVPPGDYTVYAVTGPDDLSKLDDSGNIYAKVSLKISGATSETTVGQTSALSSPTGTGQSPASTPLSILSAGCALMLGFAVFGISRR